jgi:hypothetical protein
MAASAEIVQTAVASQLRQKNAPQANAAWPGSGDHRDHRGTRSGTPTGNFADHAKLRYLVSSKRHAIKSTRRISESHALFEHSAEVSAGGLPDCRQS